MKKRKGFSLLELIIVVVVLGILASYTVPRLNRDTRAEAINHMLTMIRYTQNLALHDTKHQRNDTRWQRAYWRFQIYKCANKTGLFYMIGTDTSDDSEKNLNGKLNRGEVAVDPANGKYTFWSTYEECGSEENNDTLMQQVSPNIFITQKYGINEVTFKSCNIYKNKEDGKADSTTVKHVGFDSFGRPHKSFLGSDKPNHFGYQLKTCKITFKFADKSLKPFTIAIEPETGYAYLPENPAL